MSPTLTTATINSSEIFDTEALNAQKIAPILRLAFDANKNNAVSPETAINEGTIPYLLKAAAFADNDFRADIENILVQLGSVVAPMLLDALANNSNPQVASVAAMALIRLGRVVEKDIVKAFNNHQNAVYIWRFDFVMNQLRLHPEALTV